MEFHAIQKLPWPELDFAVGGMTLQMFSDPKLLSNYRQFLQSLPNVVATEAVWFRYSHWYQLLINLEFFFSSQHNSSHMTIYTSTTHNATLVELFKFMKPLHWLGGM